MRRLAVGLLAGGLVACGGSAPPPPEVRFVHAVTPTLAGTDAPAPGTLPSPEDKALSDVLAWLRVAPPQGPGAEFLVLTGDFGIGRAATQLAANQPAAPAAPTPGSQQAAPPPATPSATISAPPARPQPSISSTSSPAPSAPQPQQAPSEWEIKQGERIAAALRSAPADLTIYVVPGSNVAVQGDVAESLKRDQRILAVAARKLEGASVFLRDLSICYTSDGASCARRVPGTALRLIGFPGYVARSRNADGTLAAATAQTTTTQTAWVKRFESTVPTSESGVTTILVSPLTAPLTAYWATDELAQNFTKLALQHTSRGLAIHGTGTSRFVYEPQGRLLTGADRAADAGGLPDLERRLVTAPPLVLPTPSGGGQPQGVSVLQASRLGVTRQVYRYDPGVAPFTVTSPAPEKVATAKDAGSSRLGFFGALKQLPYLGRPELNGLVRWVLLAIAFISAFLTVAAIWNIPPPAPTDLATRTTTTTTTTTQGTATTQVTAAATTADQLRETFLGTRLARTVISGFAGLAAVKLATNTTLVTNDSLASGYYLVWFVIFFVTLLFASACLRGFLEVSRAAIFLGAQPHMVNVGSPAQPRRGTWRVYFLTFGDAFLNVVQGKNEMQAALWGTTIVNLQEDIVLAADRIRESIRSAVIEVLGAMTSPPEPDEIRVAISVLSEDGARVYYISWPADSLSREFGTKSVAWVAVRGGHARWWKKNATKKGVPAEPLYGDTLEIISAAEAAPLGVQGAQQLKDYFENRDQDYDAFVVLPVPFRRRGDAGTRGRGGIHISFKKEQYLDKLFNVSIDDEPNPYKVAIQLLDKANAPFDIALNQGIKVLAELLRDFNEAVYVRDIRPKRRI